MKKLRVDQKIKKIGHSGIARKTGYSRNHIKNVMNGKSSPSLECLTAIAGAIGSNLSALANYLRRKRRVYRNKKPMSQLTKMQSRRIRGEPVVDLDKKFGKGWENELIGEDQQ